MNQFQGDPNMETGLGQVQGDPNMQSGNMQSGFRQLIINSIVTKNKMDTLGNIRGNGKDPITRGVEMQSVFQQFAQMDPTTLGSMGSMQALGNMGQSFGNMGRSLGNMFGRRNGGRSRKKRKTRRR